MDRPPTPCANPHVLATNWKQLSTKTENEGWPPSFHCSVGSWQDNVKADALSRAPCTVATPEDKIDKDLSVNVASVVIQCISWVISNTEVGNDSVKDLRLAEIERFVMTKSAKI